MRYIIILSMVMLGCASCSTSRPSTESASRALESQGLVISRVVARDQVIVVRAGTNGPTYSLESRTGEVMIPAMTLGDLALSKPEFFGQIRTMQADTQWAGW